MKFLHYNEFVEIIQESKKLGSSVDVAIKKIKEITAKKIAVIRKKEAISIKTLQKKGASPEVIKKVKISNAKSIERVKAHGNKSIITLNKQRGKHGNKIKATKYKQEELKQKLEKEK